VTAAELMRKLAGRELVDESITHTRT